MRYYLLDMTHAGYRRDIGRLMDAFRVTHPGHLLSVAVEGTKALVKVGGDVSGLESVLTVYSACPGRVA